MKRYNVKIGNHVADGDGYATIAEAKRKIKKLEHADDAYDICRCDGYYKVVEREVGPWIETKGIAQKAPESAQCTPPVAQKTTKVEQPGNVAAIRKALKAVKEWFDDGMDGDDEDEMDAMLAKVEAALAAPARNCDRFNTGDLEKDAQDAMEAMLDEGVTGYRTMAKYLLSPATKQKGEFNEQHQ